ncbi:MAG: putative multidrug export ATP-binding/permease protein [Firmicutes bacterium]|nr:putative multidrug export ATP-binding/permease protein [Bacillota bacterium]
MFRLYWTKFVLPYWALTLTAVVSFIVASAATLAVPLILKSLIDVALERENLGALNVIVISVAGLYAIRTIFSYYYSYNMAKAGNMMIRNLRNEMFKKLHAMDYGYFINASTGNVISYFTNDLWLIQQAVSLGIPDLLVESLNLVAIMAVMFYFDWQLALVTFATLPFTISVVSYFNKRIAAFGTFYEEALGKVTGLLHQSIVSVSLVQSYVREDYEYDKFRKKLQEAALDLFKVQRWNAVLIPLVEFLTAIGVTIIIWYGSREVISGKLSIGGMFAFLVYIINVPAPVGKITQAVSRMKLGLVAWSRIKELDFQPATVVEGTLELPECIGHVDFKNVSFSYNSGTEVLHDINISAGPGEVIAVVGPSGAGKSSFANLLLRFYDPQQGSIYLDGIDIKQLKISALRENIGFIQQEPILFNASIIENIRYGRPTASYCEVERAAKIANVHEFIMELPEGYNSAVGELGGRLSGGQRQRIAIARAIVVEPAILLLDEPTAALDAYAEQQVMEAIRKASAGRTAFIITHRLSTLRASDKVVYLSGGMVTEQGTHEELLVKGGSYAQAIEHGEISVG